MQILKGPESEAHMTPPLNGTSVCFTCELALPRKASDSTADGDVPTQ
jgi:hypothetical protein